MVKKRICFLMILILTFSCSTLKTGDVNDQTAKELIRIITNMDFIKLATCLKTPFLLDSEILLLENDVKGFWKRALSRGGWLEDPVIIEVKQLSINDSDAFYKSTDVKMFFSKYIKDEIFLAKVKSNNNIFYFLFKPGKNGKIEFAGFRGPV